MYAIESKHNFQLEAIALLARIQEMISSKSTNVDVNVKGQPSKEIATNMSVLNTHEFKIKEVISRVEAMSEADWIASKSDLHKDFKAAIHALETKAG